MQPGVGYRFVSSSSGVTLDISNPWPEDDTGETLCPLQIYGLRYDADEDMYYINVSPGMVNNLGVTDPLAVPLSDSPAPDIQVFTAGLTSTLVTNYVYIACENEGDPDFKYPSSTVPPYITIETSEQVDTDDIGYLLIGIVQGSTDVATDTDTLITTNYKGCGSLWSVRLKCGTDVALYWWSAV